MLTRSSRSSPATHAYRIVAMYPDVAAHVQKLLRQGFGDVDRPTADWEFVSEVRTCPHVGCEWSLDVEWKDRASYAITRSMGIDRLEVEAQRHLETHLDPTI